MESTTLASVRNILDRNDGEIMDRLKNTQLFGKKTKGDTPVTTLQSTNYLYGAFRILGIYMPHQYKFLYVIYSIILNGLVTVFLPLAFTISFLILSDIEIGRLLTSIQVAINVYGCAIKIWIMLFMVKKLRVANAVFERLDARCKDEDEIHELREMRHLGRKFVVLFAAAYWSYATSTFLSSVVTGHPPYDLYLPVINWRRSRLEFVLASMIEFLLMDVACFQQVSTDSYGVIYVCILRTHMKILLLRLRKLGTKSEMSMEDNMEELKLCVKDHKTLLELYNIVAPIISITIFVQFMITATILGITLINILIFATDFSAIVASCFYVLAVVVEIFPLCYYSTCLINDSDKLAQQLFHSDWLAQGVRYGRMLTFFMQHTQRSMELTAGKIFPITLNSFMSIAKFSFSLYTFIRKMDINNKIARE